MDNYQENQYYPPMQYSNYPTSPEANFTDNAKVICLDFNNPAIRSDLEMLKL